MDGYDWLAGIIGLLIMAIPVVAMWFYYRGREDERKHRPTPRED